MEWKLFEGDHSEFASAEWYVDRIAAHHLEEEGHRDRLLTANLFVQSAILLNARPTVSDLGCGDGGLLSLFKDDPGIKAWGYDMCPDNIDYAVNVRGVDARLTDFNDDASIEYGDISVMTEVLEHLEDPHSVVRNLPSKFIVASSPAWETDEYHYEFHLWAWDVDGYRELLEQGGYTVVHTEIIMGAQVVLAVRNDPISY
jgi:hypothetical protein